jgi:hypothetical protein
VLLKTRFLQIRGICGDRKATLPVLLLIPVTTSNRLLWLKVVILSLKLILILLELILAWLDLYGFESV